MLHTFHLMLFGIIIFSKASFSVVIFLQNTNVTSTHPNKIENNCELIRGSNDTFTCTSCDRGNNALVNNNLCSVSFCSRKGSKNCWNMNSSSVIWDIKRSVYREPYCQCKIVDPSQDVQFDKDYLGVIYAPFDMHQKGWQAYEGAQMKSQLKMVSQKFRNISMYGMSTIGYSDGWKEGIKDFPSAKMAAEINAESGTLQVSMGIGIYRKLDWKTKNVGLAEEEIKTAVQATKSANKLFPRTVWGISIHMDYSTGNKPWLLEEEILDVANLVDFLKEYITSNTTSNEGGKISVGIRLWHCSRLLNSQMSSKNGTKMNELLQKLDFLICCVPPTSNFDLNNTEFAKGSGLAESVMQKIQGVRNLTKAINPHLEVIGESGIQFLKLAELDFIYNIKTFQNFWFQMADLASHLKIRVYMYEAIDEYWKTEITTELTDGEYYYKSHCGWWGRQESSSRALYNEKVTGYLYDIGPILETSNSFNFLWIGIVIALLAVLLIAGVSLIVIKKRQTWPVKQLPIEPVIAIKYINAFMDGKCPPDECDDNITVAWRLPYNRKYELTPDQFEIDWNKVLGVGMTGKVYKGTVNKTQDRQDAAFKVVTGESSLSSIKSIMSEIKILSYLATHPNVISLLGAYTANIEKGIIYAAIEYCELGSLEDILKYCQPNFGTFCNKSSSAGSDTLILNRFEQIPPGYKNPNVPINYKVGEFTLRDLTFWAHDVACGMEYVAKLGVVHADLATRNILITGNRRAKITDFGLSLKLYSKLIACHDESTRVPWRYLSPEALRHLNFSTESDVWAFGITLWEMFSLGRIPYLDKEYSLQFIEDLENSKLMTCPRYAGEEMCSLMISCWKIDPKKRPSFKFLKEELAKILE